MVDILTKSKAVILECYGMGNIPTNNDLFIKALTDAINRNVIIIIKTQCYNGGVNDMYETGRKLVNLGAVLAHDMTLECIIAKTAYLIGKGYSIDKIKQQINLSLRGELTDQKKQEKN